MRPSRRKPSNRMLLNTVRVCRQHAIRVATDDTVVTEGANAGESFGANRRHRLPGRAQLLVRGAKVGAIVQRPRRRGLLIEGKILGDHGRERVRQLQWRVERKIQRPAEIELRAVALVARRNQLRTDACELRLSASDVESDATAGLELDLRDN